MAFMKEDTRKALKLVGLASTLGLTIVIATFIGLALGLWLDRVFDTSPWLTIIFLLLGIVAGFRNFYRLCQSGPRSEGHFWPGHYADKRRGPSQ